MGSGTFKCMMGTDVSIATIAALESGG
jgi:hypothetical protein